jgi:hypothetical protein
MHFINGEQKTLPTERRPAALMTLSRQQDESWYTKLISELNLQAETYIADYEAVRAAEGN